MEGPASHVEGLEFIQTEEINLDGRIEDFYVRTRLDVQDPYLSFPSGDSVGFQGVIIETVILKTIEDIGLVYIDLPPDLNITDSEIKGSIKVQGKQLLFDSTSSGDFGLIADCSGIVQPGEYEVDVTPIIPAGMAVLRYTPDNLTINVQRMEGAVIVGNRGGYCSCRQTGKMDQGSRHNRAVFSPYGDSRCRCPRGPSKYVSLAARFAAKEALGKAFGTGLKGIKLKDIQVFSDHNGKPDICVHGTAKKGF